MNPTCEALRDALDAGADCRFALVDALLEAGEVEMAEEYRSPCELNWSGPFLWTKCSCGQIDTAAAPLLVMQLNMVIAGHRSRSPRCPGVEIAVRKAVRSGELPDIKLEGSGDSFHCILHLPKFLQTIR